MMSCFRVPDPDGADGDCALHRGAIVVAGLGWGLFACVDCGAVIRLHSIARHCAWPYVYLGTDTVAWPPARGFIAHTADLWLVEA